jgi:glycosyltransferase involved in cell wall biosynthesis
MICHINLAKGFRGGERQTELLIKELAKKGVKQKLIIRSYSPLKDRLKDIRNLRIITISKPYMLSIGKVASCDILHAHETKAAQFAYIAHVLYGMPYFITRRVNFVPKDNFFNRRMYGKAKKVFAISTSVDKSLKKRFSSVNTEIIPSAHSNLDVTEKLDLLKQKYSGYFVVGHIGALVVEDKGQNYIIEAAKKLKNSRYIKFIFVGSGKDEKILKSQVEKYDIDNVVFEGFKDNVGDYLSLFDLFLFPSLNEGLGSILLDAMYFAKPIIATNVGGILDIIKDGYNGILINPKSADEISDAIMRLYEDSGLRKRLSENAKKESKQFSMEHLVNKYIERYEESKRRNS